MASFDKAIVSLELNKVLELLADCAQTDGARELCLSLRPTGDIVAVRRLLRQTTDAKKLEAVKGTPPLSGVRDVSDSISRAEKGSSLNTRELLDVANLLNTTRRLGNYISENSKKAFLRESLFLR